MNSDINQYIVDKDGNKTHVIIPISDYVKLMRKRIQFDTEPLSKDEKLRLKELENIEKENKLDDLVKYK